MTKLLTESKPVYLSELECKVFFSKLSTEDVNRLKLDNIIVSTVHSAELVGMSKMPTVLYLFCENRVGFCMREEEVLWRHTVVFKFVHHKKKPPKDLGPVVSKGKKETE